MFNSLGSAFDESSQICINSQNSKPNWHPRKNLRICILFARTMTVTLLLSIIAPKQHKLIPKWNKTYRSFPYWWIFGCRDSKCQHRTRSSGGIGCNVVVYCVFLWGVTQWHIYKRESVIFLQVQSQQRFCVTWHLVLISETEEVTQAFLKACQHGTHPSYRARINIIGHSGAGKTSLIRRLLGQKFQKDEESTDGIETHRIEFDLNDSPLGSHKWTEAELSTKDLSQEFQNTLWQTKEKLAKDEHIQSTAQEPGDTLPAKASVAESPTGSLGQDQAKNEHQHTARNLVKEEIIQELKEAMDKSSLQPPKNSNSPDKGVLRLWDFGGQTEFYATHHMFLDAEAINIVVMDLSKPFRSRLTEKEKNKKTGVPSTQEEFLCYWLRSIEAKMEEAKENDKERQEAKLKPKVILVFTHLDASTSVQAEHFIADAKACITKFKLLEVSDSDMFCVDNNKGSEENFRDLRLKLQQVISSLPTWGMLRPVKWLQVEAAMREKKSGETTEASKYLKINTAEEVAKDYQMDPEELNSFLLFLHLMGDIVFYSHPALWEVVTLEPQWLVNIFKTLITAEEFMVKKLTNAQEFIENADLTGEVLHLLKTGTVRNCTLSAMWQGEDVGFLVELLQKFGLILPVTSRAGADRRFLVPCMLPQPEQEVDLDTVKPFVNLRQIYKSEHRSAHTELFPVGTFARLLVTCAKEWHLREDAHLSHRCCCFTTTGEFLLTLQEPHGSTIAVQLWCDPAALSTNPVSHILRSRLKLKEKMADLKIPLASKFEIICPHWHPTDQQLTLIKTTESCEGEVRPLMTSCNCHKTKQTTNDFQQGKTILWNDDVFFFTWIFSGGELFCRHVW